MAMNNLIQTANQMLSSGISKEFYDLVKNISESQSRQVRQADDGPPRRYVERLLTRLACADEIGRSAFQEEERYIKAEKIRIKQKFGQPNVTSVRPVATRAPPPPA